MCAGSSVSSGAKRSHEGPLEDDNTLERWTEPRPRKRSRAANNIGSDHGTGSSGLSHGSHDRFSEPKTTTSSLNMASLDLDNTSSNNKVLSSKQEKIVQPWYQNYMESEGDIIQLDKRIKALSTAIDASPDAVLAYIRQKQRIMPNTRPTQSKYLTNMSPLQSAADPPREHYNLTSVNTHLPSTTLLLVEKYVSACRRRRSQTDGRRSVNTGPFRCTFGCGYRTKRAFDWRRHEETHEPQELWLCELCCQTDALNPFLVNRKDKFLRHTADKHAEYSAERVLDMSKVPFVPRAAEGCPYCCVGDTSKGWSWDERCKHVLGHFEDEVERSLRRPVIISEEHQSAEEGEDRSSVDGSAVSAMSEDRYRHRVVSEDAE